MIIFVVIISGIPIVVIMACLPHIEAHYSCSFSEMVQLMLANGPQIDC